MNAEVKAMPQNASVKLNQIMISGRIDKVSKYEGKFDHIITTPAPDAFSKPSVLRLSSNHKLGDSGEEVKVLANYNGWPNSYENKNNEKVYDARGYFVAVE